MRCRECNAVIPAPADPTALTTRCSHCGLEQPAPDADARHRRALEAQREQRLRDEAEQRKKEHEWDKERARLEDKAKRADRRSGRVGRVIGGLAALIGLLIAPVVIAITVFDAPARLGYGAAGKDRLEQMQTQLASIGCKVVHPIEAEYASSAVSKLVGVGEGECLRVFAAGGPGHTRLGLKVFSPDNKELAHTRETADPQLQYCSAAAQTLRFQIDTGPAAKGRLSHMVLACPAPPAKPKPKIHDPHRH
jgi:hypothetical protein